MILPFHVLFLSCTQEQTASTVKENKAATAKETTPSITKAPPASNDRYAAALIRYQKPVAETDGAEIANPEEVEALEEESTPIVYAIEIAKTEVTQEDFTSLMGWNPSFFGGCGAQCIQNSTNEAHAQEDAREENGASLASECFDVSKLQPKACGKDCPVESVSWFDAIAYVNALSKKSDLEPCFTMTNIVCTDQSKVSEPGQCMSDTKNGIVSATIALAHEDIFMCKGYRLPSGLEWEQLLLQQDPGPMYRNAENDGALVFKGCEEDPQLTQLAWYGANSGSMPHPVGQKKPNSLGLHDMLGNVWEWSVDNLARPDLREGFSYNPTEKIQGDPDQESDLPEEAAEESQDQEDGQALSEEEQKKIEVDRITFSTRDRQQRGGSWLEFGSYCQVDQYTSMPPGDKDASTGFRVIRTTQAP